VKEYRNRENDKNIVSFPEGTVVDSYRIVKDLSNCLTSETYLTEDTSLNRQVLLNFLPSPFIRDEVAKARFIQSVKNTAKINHPNITYIHESAEYQGRPYFVTEYFMGSSLTKSIGKGLPVSYKLLDTFIQICEGLRTAHKAGLIHQGLNPGCVLINDEGHVKISKFGLANIIMNIKSLRSDLYHEAISYMAPEQLQSKRADNRSDIFSVGILLYELLTGQHPFKKHDATATSQAIIREIPVIPSHQVAEIPVEIQTIITRALQKNPEERYQYIDDLLKDLKRVGIDRPRTLFWTSSGKSNRPENDKTA